MCLESGRSHNVDFIGESRSKLLSLYPTRGRRSEIANILNVV